MDFWVKKPGLIRPGRRQGGVTVFLLAYKFWIFNAYDEIHFCDFRWISVISDQL